MITAYLDKLLSKNLDTWACGKWKMVEIKKVEITSSSTENHFHQKKLESTKLKSLPRRNFKLYIWYYHLYQNEIILQVTIANQTGITYPFLLLSNIVVFCAQYSCTKTGNGHFNTGIMWYKQREISQKIRGAIVKNYHIIMKNMKVTISLIIWLK